MHESETIPSPHIGRSLPILLVLFVGSGCAALIDEVVWLQLLQLVIGSTAVSLGVLLATFMGGMCLGSLLLPRVVPARWNPLRVYAVLELGIGAIALAVLFGMPHVEQIYVEYAGRGLPAILIRGLAAGACLLPPTILMGATLPAIARRVEADPSGVAWLGFFYGGNIAGAVVGCLLAGFYLLRVYDVAVATYAAVGINVLVAAIALIVSRRPSPAVSVPRIETERPRGSAAVYLAIAISGMAAMGGEVVWTRLLSLLFGPTVYSFSLILAVFLVGLGIGSAIGAVVARGARSPRLALGIGQLLLTAAIAWTAAMIARSLPYWPLVPSMSTSPWFTFQLDLAMSLWAVLPPAILWGASFPIAIGAVAAPGTDAGRLVGGVYAANTLGAIAGALAFGLVLVPMLGTTGAERAMIGLSAVAAISAFGISIRPARLAGIVATIAIAAVVGWSVTPVPWALIAFGRETPAAIPNAVPGVVDKIPEGADEAAMFCRYVGEGENVSVAVLETPQGVRSFHGAGKVQASNQPVDMRLQRMLGHIPALLHPKPKTVLVVACGAGVTAGSFVVHPDVERIVICDIEPIVPQHVTPMFGEQNYHVVDGIARENPHVVNGKQVEVIYDDGRHYLSTTREKFDVITSDPIDPWVKGCAALNTIEYYRMCRDHLNPGGSVSLWMPLYEANAETTQSLISTFFEVFPNAILWSNERQAMGADALFGEQHYGYDAILFGQVEPTVIDVDALQRRIDRPDHEAVKQSLLEVGFGGPDPMSDEGTMRPESIELLATYAGQAPMLGDWSKGAQINTDRNLRLQYLAGMWLNTNMGPQNLAGILAHYRFPEKTFVGSAETIATLKRVLRRYGRVERPAPGRPTPGS